MKMDDDPAFTDFIRGKIEKAGGSAQIKYLYQFLPGFKNTTIRTQGELMSFIRKRSHMFQIDANANIRIRSSSSYEDKETKFKENENENYDKPKKDFPLKLEDAEGVVIKLHPTFGFIAVKHPLKTVVYFTPSSFGKKNTLFADFADLDIGTKLRLDAIRGNEDHYSKYRALRVRFVQKKEKEEIVPQIPNSCAPKPRKTRDTGLYDPVVNEGEGKIFKLFPNYGFIAIEDNKNNTVFFYKNQISNYENVLDLTKALKVGDLVEFKAVRSSMKNIKARWSATQVWIKKSDKIKVSSNSNKSRSNEETSTEEERYVQKIPGKIFPHSKGTVIKFGKNYEKLADADSGLFYMLGSKVQDVSWEFSDGDNVLFDAVKIKSHPGWKAILIWTGERPRVVLPPELGDFSEYADEPDNVPDSASCVSKSSNNSVTSDISNKSFQKPFSKSSGYSSMKDSQENINQSKKYKFRNTSGRKKFDNELDDLSDSASCYSRSSNVSSEGSHRFSKNRNQKRNDSNYKRSPNKFQKRNDSDSYKKSSFEGRNFAAHNAGTFSKPRKQNFKSHLEFVQSDLPNSKAETVDDNPNTLTKNRLLFLGNSQTEQTYTNWGDSPYPDEENDNQSVPEEFVQSDLPNSKADTVDDQYSIDRLPSVTTYTGWKPYYPDEENDNQSVPEDKEANSLSDRGPSPYGNFAYDSNTTDCDEKEMYSSGDEFSESEQNHSKPSTKKDQAEQIIELLESNENDEQELDKVERPKKASITRFHEIQGTVTKVYCKYANISSPKLQMPASFFWSDLYLNGTLVSNNGVDDLREVLKEGNVLNLNCYQVINDEGHCFIKVTMVWRGKKPNIVEITPQQFIYEHNLSVTLHEDNICDYSEKDNSPSTSQNSPEGDDDDVDQKITKFLTVVSDSEDEVEIKAQNSVSEKDNKPNDPSLYSPPSASKGNDYSSEFLNKEESENLTDVDFDLNKNQLIEKIGKIISSNASEGDVMNTSSKIVDFLFNSGVAHKFSTFTKQTKETESQTVSSADVHIKNDSVQFTESEVQTIFTGEVIGKSIFTMC